MNPTRFQRPALLIILATTAALFAGFSGCKKPGETDLPDNRYLYPPGAALPEGAQTISEDEFAKLYNEGSLTLTGPEAEKEAEAREAKQDEEDLATIDAFQKANPNAEPVLRELVLPRDGSVKPVGPNLQINVLLKNSREGSPFLTMGQRFRLRSAARSLREYPKKENQLTTYKIFYEGLSESWRAQLGLIAVDAAAKLDSKAITEFNNKVARNWAAIIAGIEFGKPVLPPSCDGDEGRGTGGDRTGNAATCTYSNNGLMMNYPFDGKEHISCVKNQASRGTCPAFSSVSTMEYSIHKRFGRRTNLSEQALYARMKLIWGAGQTYGDGYWPAAAFTSSFDERFLVPWEEQWNYNPSNSRQTIFGPGTDGMLGTADDPIVEYRQSCNSYTETCSNTAHQAATFCVSVGLGTFCGYVYPNVNPSNYGFRIASGSVNFWDAADRDLSVAKMILASALFKSQVVWSFDIETSSWNPNADGFVTHTSATQNTNSGAHAVHVVGWITNERLRQIMPNAPLASGSGYFIMKNSWSTCWGDAGFAYVPSDSVRNYTLEMVSAPLVE